MTVKSRIITIEVPDPDSANKVYYFTLRGIDRVSFSLDVSVGTAQGIAANFIHPWFIKPVTVSLSGSSYIGTFYNVKDAVTTDLDKPVRQPKQESLWGQLKQLGAKETLKKYFTRKEPSRTEELKAKKSLEADTYYRTQQLPFFIEKLHKISEKVRIGIIRTRPEVIKQKLTISDYVYNYESITFEGFLSSVKVEENARKLGLLGYDISFVGTPKLEEESAKEKAKEVKQQVSK